jgi:pyruvate dehydrogenase kinase 2/3/4
MCIMPSVLTVRAMYTESFRQLQRFAKPIRTDNEQADFTRCLEMIYTRHSGLHFMVARGLYELYTQLRDSSALLATTLPNDLSDYYDLHEQLDQFYLSRVGIRTLIAHHLELQRPPRAGHAGVICVKTCPREVAQDAIASASLVCNRTFNRAPKVTLYGKKRESFPYIPSHIYYMLFELLKNSMRATAEFHKDAATLPPIRVVIAGMNCLFSTSVLLVLLQSLNLIHSPPACFSCILLLVSPRW